MRLIFSGRRAGLGLAITFAGLVLALIWGVMTGQAGLSLGQVLAALGDLARETVEARIIWDYRIARLLVALMAGAQLSVSGAILQGITRNALASPDLVGITGGAGLAAVVTILLLPATPPAVLPFVAFFGGTITGAIVYLVSWKDGVAPERLALVGIAVSAISQAGITALLALFSDQLHQALTWITGSLYGRSWPGFRMLVPWFLPTMGIAILLAGKIDILVLGDQVAAGLGIRVELARAVLIGLAIGLAASAVSVVGTIRFLGLVVPHLVRIWVGVNHRLVILFSILVGALLLVLSDSIARTAIRTLELPAGLITALIGAPYFIYLLGKRQTRLAL